MKTRKLNFEDFKENSLGRKQIMNVSGGGDTDEYYVYNPKTGELELHYSIISPAGGGNGNGNSGDGKIVIP